MVLDKRGNEQAINAPKTIERLEHISESNYNKRKQEEEEESDSDALNIGGDISLDTLDVFDMTKQTILNDDPMIDIEVL